MSMVNKEESMSVSDIRRAGSFIVKQYYRKKTNVSSDGKDGADDGTNHVHPEKCLNFGTNSDGRKPLKLDTPYPAA